MHGFVSRPRQIFSRPLSVRPRFWLAWRCFLTGSASLSLRPWPLMFSNFSQAASCRSIAQRLLHTPRSSQADNTLDALLAILMLRLLRSLVHTTWLWRPRNGLDFEGTGLRVID